MPPRAKAESVIGVADDGVVAPWEDAGATDTGAEVEVRQAPITGVIATRDDAVQDMMQWVVDRVDSSDIDSMSGLNSIISEYLTASDPVALLREKLPRSGQDMVDQPFTLHGFRMIESDFTEDESCPAYASMQVTLIDSGDQAVINCGGWGVVTQCRRLEEMSAFPVNVVLKAGKAKKGKNPPLRLTLAE